MTDLVVNAANKYGYSFKLWNQYIEPKLVFWQPQDGDQHLPDKAKDDAKPLLMKVCSFDSTSWIDLWLGVSNCKVR